jgi:hypothetical protein
MTAMKNSTVRIFFASCQRGCLRNPDGEKASTLATGEKNPHRAVLHCGHCAAGGLCDQIVTAINQVTDHHQGGGGQHHKPVVVDDHIIDMLVSFICYAFNLTLSTWVGGVAMRYRLYSRLGLDQ